MNEPKKFDAGVIAILNKQLPAEALKQHPTKAFLTTIKAIFVIDRLNEAFGHGLWKVTNEVIDKSTKMVVVKSTLTLTEYPHVHIESFGGNDNVDMGDAYKGACTDALTKIGSYLGIGADIWRGTQSGTKEASPANVDERPWLKQDQYEAMLGFIDKGKQLEVAESMKKYRIKNDWKSILELKLKAA